MLLFANSLDGVRGWFSFRDPARHGRPGGDFPCGADTRHSRRAPQFERRTIVGTAAPSCPAERSSAHCSALLSAISKKTSVEDGRPRPSRFEHSRASQIPSRHHEPRRGGRIWKKNRVRAAFSYPPTNRRSRFQKHGKSGVTTPTTNLLKMVFWSCAYVPLAGIRM